MGVPSAGFEANWYNLHFQGRNTPFQAFFGGSAAVGKITTASRTERFK